MNPPNSGEILIIDDNPDNIQVLAGLLGREGYAVSACLSGEQALEFIVIDAHRPELVLLDVMMPGMDGYETCRKIKEFPSFSGIPVIFLTARGETEDIVNGFRAGAVDYVGKPFHPEELLARVQTHIALRRARTEIAILRNLMPVCAWCKKVHCDDNTWEPLEAHVAKLIGSQVSHGICPDYRDMIEHGLDPRFNHHPTTL